MWSFMFLIIHPSICFLNFSAIAGSGNENIHCPLFLPFFVILIDTNSFAFSSLPLKNGTSNFNISPLLIVFESFLITSFQFEGVWDHGFFSSSSKLFSALTSDFELFGGELFEDELFLLFSHFTSTLIEETFLLSSALSRHGEGFVSFDLASKFISLLLWLLFDLCEYEISLFEASFVATAVDSWELRSLKFFDNSL